MIADGTVLRLHEFLSDEFQARHEEQAGPRLVCAKTEYSTEMSESPSEEMVSFYSGLMV